MSFSSSFDIFFHFLSEIRMKNDWIYVQGQGQGDRKRERKEKLIGLKWNNCESLWDLMEIVLLVEFVVNDVHY